MEQNFIEEITQLYVDNGVSHEEAAKMALEDADSFADPKEVVYQRMQTWSQSA